MRQGWLRALVFGVYVVAMERFVFAWPWWAALVVGLFVVGYTEFLARRYFRVRERLARFAVSRDD